MLASQQQVERASSNTTSIFTWLRSRQLLDTRGYAMAPLRQRALRRMGSSSAASVEEYIAKLSTDAGERAALLAELLESRSSFGTDAGIWRAVAAQLAASRASRAALRVRFSAWSVGCATGEEAYTLAMMFAEAFGLEAIGRHVEIYGTDIDDTALAIANEGRYDATSIASLPPSTVSDYFDRRDGAFVVKEPLRRVVRFLRHDLLREMPLGKMHLVVCRDLAGSLSVAGRRRATRRLVRALATGGLLVFGRGEWPEIGSHLETVDPVRGIYRKATDGG